ncbi:MAG: phosphatase PAP2 family protein [Gammaproteobacteria bacterium]|nr:phosphatase PAP2 family protein [Gammaproteobacteria bacterium]MCH9744511.1 phosphatase PAP2 family protein [Gammaproteobacteria bacterium]
MYKRILFGIIGCAFVIDSCQASIESVGTALQIALPVFAGSTALIKKDYKGFKQFAYATLFTFGVTYILKPTLDERRPDGGSDSFPSGHTAISFAASTYMWRRYNAAYGIPLTGIASFVGYSRVESKRHYVWDVMAGAALGIGANMIFTSKFKNASVGVEPVNKGAVVQVGYDGAI